ncbi:hypothetical protein [Algibacter pacificus]|uniref:hypothetical protein n=1 Tax=Algibacter pacificus TaxID=2599389 RepID=UPI0011CAAAC6|nr:hypothetical protein [Algibacter pacificus]
MKNVIKHLKKGFLMVTMFATLLSFANEVSFITITNGVERTSLTLTDVKQGNLLSLKDENGIILYKEFIQKSGNYTKGFDLTELPNGTYSFEVDKDVEISTIPFTVIEGAVTFNKEDEKTIYKPVTRVVGDLLYVTKLSLDKAPLKIDIYYDSISDGSFYEPVHSETIENTKVIERVYKLTNLEHGNFEVVYQTEGRTFTKSIH